MEKRDVETLLRASAGETSRQLRAFARRHIPRRDAALLNPILHAIDISAPLRERFFVSAQAAGHCRVGRSSFEPFAISGELMMIAAFVSDDIVDRSARRAGAASVAAAFGVGQAALAAEAILLLAETARMSLAAHGDASRTTAAARMFAEAGVALYRGQFRSITGDGRKLSLRELHDMTRLRAGYLFAACAAAPAVLAGDDRAARALFRYGECVGIASQQRDDILDFIGNEETMGKPTLQDLSNNQPNLVWTVLRSTRNDGPLKALVSSAAGSRPLSRSRRRQIVRIARNSDAVERSLMHLKTSTKNALAALALLPPSEATAVLRAFASLIGDAEER